MERNFLAKVRPRRLRRQQRPLALESLEARYALAGQLTDVLPRFGSTDALREYLLNDALDRYASLFGQPAGQPCWDLCYLREYGLNLGALPPLGDGVEVADGGFSGSSSSATNIQVPGVDEGDIVEVDDRFLYVMGGSQIAIVAATPADAPHVTSRIDVEGRGIAEFLYGDRLTVISTDSYWDDPQPLVAYQDNAVLRPLPYASYHSTVTVTVYDVSDRSAPQLVEQTRLDGAYRDSRAIDDKVIVVVSNGNLELPPPERICDASAVPKGWPPVPPSVLDPSLPEPTAMGLQPMYWDPEAQSICTYETRDAWLARVEPQIDSLVTDLLPHFTSYGPDHELVRAGLLHEPADLVRPVSPHPSQLLSIVSFDVDDRDPGVLAAEGIATGLTGQVYASRDAVVVWEPDWQAANGSMSTRLLMYDWDVDTGSPRAAAVGLIPGLVLNPFALDEHDGYLRVATTSYGERNVNGEWVSLNHLTVLLPHDGKLEIVGQLTDFGTDEQIRSVRFLGDVAYVVTFRQIDPLFTIDLSDPMKPHVVGELEMPGFSGYLQMIDDRHLLGLGRSTDGAGHWWPRLAMFDVSDLAHPTQVAEYLLPAGGSTIAETDHHAFLWDPVSHLLALPITMTVEGPPTITEDGSQWPTWRQVGELMVLHVETAPVAGPLPAIRLAGEIHHDSLVLRGAIVGDHIYSVSQTDLKVAGLADPSAVIAALEMFPPEPPAPYDDWWRLDPAITPWRPWSEDGKDRPAPTTTPSPTDDDQLATMLDLSIADLAQRMGVTAADIRLITAESARWGDGGLGFGLTTLQTTGSTVDGFQLVLGIGGQRYLYHTDTTDEVELADEHFAYVSQPPVSPWHNGDQPLDTTGDGVVSPLDALVIINELNDRGARELRSQYPLRAIAPPDSDPLVELFWDVDGDRYLAPLDALRVINWLNGHGSGEGEGGQFEGELPWGVGATGLNNLFPSSAGNSSPDSLRATTPTEPALALSPKRTALWPWCVAVDHVASDWS